ncbi:hypothetical protein MKW94_021035 [Papaver nudicaule]|uniref:Uncharacterized protein n=1 Tax=Papaver nudicaule TaxID=74823 RepID=A0AA41SEU1_PAPNU|nr:hypothetical protein [Papaver nudicaule]
MMTTEHKRRPEPSLLDHGTLTSNRTTKRHKSEGSISAKERKEKIGERIVALQQLVSPFGKTDTASVLSAPYLQNTTLKSQESQLHSLRSRGLCLMPISCTLSVARSNGADLWAPIKGSSPKL